MQLTGRSRTGQLILTALCGMAVAGNAYGETSKAVDKLTAAAYEHRLALHHDGKTFDGPAWDLLVREGREARFFLVGEEHGIAENPRLVAQLFAALVGNGYEKFVIEISPAMARIVDEALASNGLEGLKALYSEPGGEPAFFGMREEAQMLAAVRAALPDADEVLWGVDYEVASDRPLLRALLASSPPDRARAPLDALVAASQASWDKYEQTRNPQFIFSFAGDPALVAAVRAAWPGPGETVDSILQTLQTTLEINRLWIDGRGSASNARRALHIRENFLRHWHAARRHGSMPKVMVKLGANHAVRGLTGVGTFDLGTLLPEIAATRDERSISLLVRPGRESMTAVLNPSPWTYEPKPANDGYAGGLEPLIDSAYPDKFTLIDLRPLREIVGARTKSFADELLRIVHGFDLLLVMSGSTPSADLGQ